MSTTNSAACSPNELIGNDRGQFAPGVSGNPSGRPKADRVIQELARTHTPEALSALVEIATKGRSESARVAAAVAILDRGWGRPPACDHQSGETNVKVVMLPKPCYTVEEWCERYVQNAAPSNETLRFKNSSN
jgi:hypothetical protein